MMIIFSIITGIVTTLYLFTTFLSAMSIFFEEEEGFYERARSSYEGMGSLDIGGAQFTADDLLRSLLSRMWFGVLALSLGSVSSVLAIMATNSGGPYIFLGFSLTMMGVAMEGYKIPYFVNVRSKKGTSEMTPVEFFDKYMTDKLISTAYARQNALVDASVKLAAAIAASANFWYMRSVI